MEETSKITLINDLGEEEEFFVVEQTRLNNTDYLLVTVDETGDTDAYILKDVSAKEDEEAVYEFVDDDTELDALADIFAQLLDEEADIADQE